jgi:hypothetical protein
MLSQEQIDEIKSKVIPTLKQYGVKKAAIFGSVVRGEAEADSDIDILVEIESDMSLLDFVKTSGANLAIYHGKRLLG